MRCHHLLHRCAFHKGRLSPGNKNQIHIPVVIQPGPQVPQSGPDDTTAAVAPDGVADLLAGGDADPQMFAPVFGHIGDQNRGNSGFAFGVGFSEIPVVVDSRDLIPFCRPIRRGSGAMCLHCKTHSIPKT